MTILIIILFLLTMLAFSGIHQRITQLEVRIMATLQEKFNEAKQALIDEKAEVKAALEVQAAAIAAQEVKIAELLALVEELKAQIVGGGDAISVEQIDEIIEGVKNIHQVDV